ARVLVLCWGEYWRSWGVVGEVESGKKVEEMG
nr:hypothetical protein [Tanacetum cinerariifolium]